MKVHHIKHHQIDKEKYNHFITQSPQGTVYAMSWYLDVVSPGWELLVSENYNMVMPLPVKEKFGVEYVIQPHFCQQLGVFSNKSIDVASFEQFVSEIPYGYCNILFNAGNVFENRSTRLRQNYLLVLSQDYETIQGRYKLNCKQNIKKAESCDFIVSIDTDQQQYIQNLSVHTPDSIDLFKKLLKEARKNEKTEIWSVRDQSGRILSSALFLHWNKRAYYLMPFSSPEGRKNNSMTLLIDCFIRHYAMSGLTLDFEGSCVDRIARFYEGFGSMYELYPVMVKEDLISKVYSFLKRKSPRSTVIS